MGVFLLFNLEAGVKTNGGAVQTFKKHQRKKGTLTLTTFSIGINENHQL